MNENQLVITHKSEKSSLLNFSIPFGQAYFFLLFFLNFKPKYFVLSISIYNFLLIPLYIRCNLIFKWLFHSGISNYIKRKIL